MSASVGSDDNRVSRDALYACHVGPTNFHGQPAIELPMNATVGVLDSFTFDLWIRFTLANLEAGFLVHHMSNEGPRRRRGFSLTIMRHGSGDDGEICFFLAGDDGRIINLETTFRGDEMSDKWSRISCTVDASKDTAQARLFINLQERSHGNFEAVLYRPPPFQETLLLGSSNYRGEIKQAQFFRGVISWDMISEARTHEDISTASSHMRALGISLWSQRRVFSDCVIIADDGMRWPVHRSVLMACSRVFARMFQGGLKEALQNEPIITIKDAASADIESFLHFLYTGYLPQDAELKQKRSLVGVMCLSDMYEVPGLIRLVVKDVEDSISAENIVDVVKAMNKRKADASIGAAYKRICCKIQEDEVLAEKLMDSL